tara:strand:+ start:314 stop:691 length:378 start_codon:yes stop_codon:yes gene_type:complete
MPVEFKEDSIKDWVINNLEEGQIAEVVLHGCSGGVVPELIYYADSCAFYEQYEGEIWDRLDQMSCDMGEASILHLIATFNGAKSVGSHDQFRNLLAWWACEDVCREIIADKEADEEAQADSLVST